MYEALAYCAWLTECLQLTDIPIEHQIHDTIRLPSEDEWEYATRGPNGLRYANDDQLDPQQANYADTKLQRTSAVGLFLPGQAFKTQGDVFDQTGNVWEWTQSRWGKSVNSLDFDYQHWQEQHRERNDPNPVELRVIRGGSWYDNQRDVRCAIRSGNHSSYRSFSLGFRVVFSLADSDH